MYPIFRKVPFDEPCTLNPRATLELSLAVWTGSRTPVPAIQGCSVSGSRVEVRVLFSNVLKFQNRTNLKEPEVQVW